MLTLEEIKKAIVNTEFDFYGIRVDDGIRYNVGDIANYSHQLFQDPAFDECGELIYPYIEDGRYAGFYDAGEFDGTCSIGFDPEDDESIVKAIERMGNYFGEYIHVLAGNDAEGGNDLGEIIIRDAVVLALATK